MTAMATEHELTQLDEEIRRLDAEHTEKKAAADKVVSDIRESGVNPLTDADAFTKVDEAYKVADTVAEQSSQLRQRRERVMEQMGRRRPAPPASVTQVRGGGLDVVEAFMSTAEYQRLRDTGAFHAGSGRIELPRVELLSREGTIHMLQRAVAHAVADIEAAVPEDQRLFPPVPVPVRPVTVTELIGMSTTDSDTVDFVEETTRTDAAAETAPGTASPEATYVYTERQALVRDISHFTPAHRRNLADAGQMRALLEGRLRSGVDRRFESQIVSGDGVGQNLTGILNTTGIASIARDTANNEPRLEAIHRGITAVRLNLFADPTAIGLHPSDYEEVVFEKGSDGHYLLGPASQQTSRTIWGFTTSITTAFPQNTSLVGQYREGAQAWIRSGVAVTASDSHSDFFTRRMVALLAEMRAAFAAWQPAAFSEVTLL